MENQETVEQGQQTSAPTGVQQTTVVEGPNGPFPAELNKWNWGAFLLNWIWSIGNSVWIGLIALIPISPINLIMAIVLGIKGNEWAWKNKKWESVEQFKQVQAKWTKWALIIWGIFLALFVLAIALVITVAIFAVKSGPGYVELR